MQPNTYTKVLFVLTTIAKLLGEILNILLLCQFYVEKEK